VRLGGALVLAATVSAITLANLSCNDSGCDAAQQLDVMAIGQVCAVPPYLSNSTFCVLCTNAGYYSITTSGGGKCVCATLTYDQAACSDARNASDRLAAARSAVDFADTTCSTISLPGDGGFGDGGPAHVDAGADR
jgi:hypothetical protein